MIKILFGVLATLTSAAASSQADASRQGISRILCHDEGGGYNAGMIFEPYTVALTAPQNGNRIKHGEGRITVGSGITVLPTTHWTFSADTLSCQSTEVVPLGFRCNLRQTVNGVKSFTLNQYGDQGMEFKRTTVEGEEFRKVFNYCRVYTSDPRLR